ncbi:hypothetical protein VRB50_03245 [Pseudomonas poae]|uniref:hypothetical protein n=1 Tax=Pseudomonas poae TaxID=200451 RepID=UPI0030CF578C
MDKIYKLLPWLNSPQAVDWLCRLTDTQMTEELLICLCGAGHARIYIDVGGACLGVDDEDWSCEVVASGKQMVVDPSALAKPDADRSHILLRGEVLNLSDGKKDHRKDVDWFPNRLNSIFLCFKQADILALADKVNADETAQKAELIAQVERYRKDREITLNELHEAQEEIAGLQDKLDLALTNSPDIDLNSTSKKSHLLAIGGLLRLIKDPARPRYNQAGAVSAISAMGWAGASNSNLNHIFAEANSSAKDADSEREAKLEALGMAVKNFADT